jgi:hypothetical protein
MLLYTLPQTDQRRACFVFNEFNARIERLLKAILYPPDPSG